ncbi:MAG: OB-fold nucleic acid binding domain-containing protein, partial [bacterium]
MAGRILTKRLFGKLAFFTLQDETGKIQLQLEKGRLGDESFQKLKAWVDAGDIIGVQGSVRRTDKGELS